MVWEIWVAGVAQPQGSARAFKFKDHVRITSDNRSLRPWRQAVTAEAQMKMAAAGPDEAVTGPVALELSFVFPRLQAHFGAKGLRDSAPTVVAVRPDVDKLARAVIDALAAAGLIHNDAQVALLTASKVYGSKPGCRIRLGHGADFPLHPRVDVDAQLLGTEV